MTDDIDPHGANFLLDRRSALLVLGALGGCAGIEQEDPAPEPPQRDTQVTIKSSDEESSEEEPKEVEASTLISKHVEALDSAGYRSETTVTDIGEDRNVSKEIKYTETVDRSVFKVVEETTQTNKIDEIRYRESGSDSTTTVTMDSGREFSFDSTGEFSTSGLALRVTGESVFRQFLMGATLRSSRLDDRGDTRTEGDSADRPLREYEFVDHDHYSLDSGELRIDDRDIIEYFDIEWEANDGQRRISVQITEVGSVRI